MSKKLKKVLRFLPPFAWMVFIFFLSSQQKIAVSSNYWFSFFIFKSLHIIEYGTLFILWYFALDRANFDSDENKKRLRLAIILSFIYAIFDEFHQTLVPSREGRARDIFIDFLGIILFWKFFLEKIKALVRENKYLKKLFILFF